MSYKQFKFLGQSFFFAWYLLGFGVFLAWGQQLVITYPAPVKPDWTQTYDENGQPIPPDAATLAVLDDYELDLLNKQGLETELRTWDISPSWERILGDGPRYIREGVLYEVFAISVERVPNVRCGEIEAIFDCTCGVTDDVQEWLSEHGYEAVE